MCALATLYYHDGIDDVILRHASMSVEGEHGSATGSKRPVTGNGNRKSENDVDPRNMVGVV